MMFYGARLSLPRTDNKVGLRGKREDSQVYKGSHALQGLFRTYKKGSQSDGRNDGSAFQYWAGSEDDPGQAFHVSKVYRGTGKVKTSSQETCMIY